MIKQLQYANHRVGAPIKESSWVKVSRHCTVYQEADTCELYESLEPVI